MSKIFLTLVVVVVALFGLSVASEYKKTIRMKSFLVVPRDSSQVRALKNALNAAPGKYYLKNGPIEPSARIEIFVPTDLVTPFTFRLTREKIQHGVHYEKVKLKLYGEPNDAGNHESRSHKWSEDNSQPKNDSGIYYEVKGFPSQKLVDVQEGYTQDNTKVILYQNHAGRNQKWALNSAPGFTQTYRNWFNFVSQDTGKCLTAGVNGAFSEDTTPIVDFHCRNPFDWSQMWAVEYDTHKQSSDPADPTYFKLIGNQGKCLTADPSGEDSTQLYLSTCTNDNTQFFNFVDPGNSN